MFHPAFNDLSRSTPVKLCIRSLGNSFFMLSCRVQGKGVLGNRIEFVVGTVSWLELIFGRVPSSIA